MYLKKGVYMQKSLINIADIKQNLYFDKFHKSFFGVWLQGCALNCPDCINKQFKYTNINNYYPVSDLIKIIKISGSTNLLISGGEPFQQPKGLYALIKTIKEIEKMNIGIIVYTGYYYQQLKDMKNKHIDYVLNNIDLLVDGPFINENKQSLFLRGSLNQSIIFLSERYKYIEKYINEDIETINLTISDRNLSITGNISNDLIKNMNNILDEAGISIK